MTYQQVAKLASWLAIIGWTVAAVLLTQVPA